MRNLLAAALIGFALLLGACSSGQKPAEQQQETKKVEPPQYETGRTVFQKLYVAGRSFAPDIKPYRLESVYTPDAPVTEGKAGIWHAQFASPSKRAIKAYTWSGLSGPDMPDRGISHGTEDSYNPANSATRVWEVMALKIDSDKAFEVAQKHGGEKLTKKDPKQPVIFDLEWNAAGANQLVWHVIYGDNRSNAKLRIMVDATTGAFLQVEH